MKIEKVNENQIRCTLTKEDLASRELKISELAYGTEKAKSLFRDMMQQANFEFGFEAEDIPLMIEAIPMNAECIVLIITKVEDPDELDTRFARFAPSVHEDDELEDIDTDSMREDALELFKKIQSDEHNVEIAPNNAETTAEKEAPKMLIRLFQFDSLHTLLQLASYAAVCDEITNTLYKELQTEKYLLLLSFRDGAANRFHKLCNIASEYGVIKRTLPSTPAYLEEHCSVILSGNALQLLSQIQK